MSEEEIIKIIQDYIATTEWLGFDHVTGECITEEDYEAIKGLLDLYNKEKEKADKYKRYFKLAISDIQSEGIFVKMNYKEIENYYSNRKDLLEE